MVTPSMRQFFHNIYAGRSVLVTGHTGFKGSWLVRWLTRLGARVTGLALEPVTEPNHWSLLGLDIPSVIADIRDRDQVRAIVDDVRPEIVFHLAAQPLVRASYADPIATFETNVMGTAYLLEACRQTPSVRVLLNITSDKCYENRERLEGYREDEPMGGYDLYSCSKGCAELVTAAYRRSFCSGPEAPLLATCRAGNVIGGGDWAEDRLVPDVMRAAARNEIVALRHPQAVRPWQHVLEPLSGYLLLGQRLVEGAREDAAAWNFGPETEENRTVLNVVETMAPLWDRIRYRQDPGAHAHEAGLLQLNCAKAHDGLGWHEVWGSDQAIRETVRWYREYYENGRVVTDQQLDDYLAAAVKREMVWTR